MRVLFAIIFSVLLAPFAIAETLAKPEGRVLLTVAGDLPQSNAPALKPEAVNVSGFLGLEYNKAVAFDDLMLGALEQHQITANLLDTGKDIVYSGPRLSTLLTAVGADGKSVKPTALDGYQSEISWDLINQHQPILATHADGVPLEIGKLGPAMVVFPVVDNQEVYASFDAMQVFATFFIAVE